MAWIQQTGIRQRKDLLVHGMIKVLGTAALEVGAPATPDQQAVAGERHVLIVQHIGQAARCVTWCCAHDKVATSERDVIVMPECSVRAFGLTSFSNHETAAEPLSKQPST